MKIDEMSTLVPVLLVLALRVLVLVLLAPALALLELVYTRTSAKVVGNLGSEPYPVKID